MEKTNFETTQDFFNLWLKTYETAFGRAFKMPAIGPTGEKSKNMMKGFSTFTDLYTSGMDSSIDFQSVSTEAMRRMQEKTASKVEGGECNPRQYKDIYDTWMETYSETFKEYLKSGHFAADTGKFMSSLMEFQIHNREMLEENYLKPMNLPTKTEIDEINKELYSLKKHVKQLTSQIKELSAKK